MSEQVAQISDHFTVYAMPAGELSLLPENRLPGEPVSLELGRNVLGLVAQGVSYVDAAMGLGVGVEEIPRELQKVQAFYGATTLAQATCLAHESGTLRVPHASGYSWLHLNDLAIEAARLARLGYDGSPASVEATGVDPFAAIAMYKELLLATNAGSNLPRAMHILYANDFFVTPDFRARPHILFRAVGAETLRTDELAALGSVPFVDSVMHPAPQTGRSNILSARQIRSIYGLAQSYDDDTLRERFNMSRQLTGALIKRVTEIMEVDRDGIARRAFDMGIFGALLPGDLQTWQTTINTPPNPWF